MAIFGYMCPNCKDKELNQSDEGLWCDFCGFIKKKNPQPKGDGEQMGEELFDYKEDVDCPSYWNFRGIFFPCDLPIHHNGPHLNYPKEEGQDAVIIWSQNEPDAERRTD